MKLKGIVLTLLATIALSLRNRNGWFGLSRDSVLTPPLRGQLWLKRWVDSGWTLVFRRDSVVWVVLDTWGLAFVYVFAGRGLVMTSWL